MIWDQGTWEPQPAYPDVDKGLRDGSLKFILHGTKLQGKWALIRMHGKSGGSEAKPNWLLIKEHDDFERPPTDPPITESEPNSVVTGRSIEQIARSQDHVWNSKDTRSGSQAWYRQESKSDPTSNARVPQPSAASSPKGGKANVRPAVLEVSDLTKLPRESQPSFIPPELAQQAEIPPSSDGWLHELKLDGYRIQARKSGSRVQLFTRTGLDWTHRMSAIATDVARVPAEHATLDGEVVVVSPDGTTSFANLQASFQDGGQTSPHLLRVRSPPPQRPQHPQPSPPRAQGSPRHAPHPLRPGHPPLLRAPRDPTAPPSSAMPARCGPRVSSPSEPPPHTSPAAAPTGSSASASTNRNSSSAGTLFPAPATLECAASARFFSAITAARNSSTPAVRVRVSPRRPTSFCATNSTHSSAPPCPSSNRPPNPLAASSGSSPHSLPRFASPRGPRTTSYARPHSSACVRTSPPPRLPGKPPPQHPNPPSPRPAQPHTSGCPIHRNLTGGMNLLH